MGCNCDNCNKCEYKNKIEEFDIKVDSKESIVIALAGNPNVGKSTVFNALTGLNQHTGNWPGKTVANASGSYMYKDKKFTLVDLPGTYSLLANSVEEEVARDFICFGKPHATIVVADATCFERNLNLVYQVMEITDKVVLCLNLLDEAKRKGIYIDIEKLEKELRIPVIGTCARKKEGLNELIHKVYNISLNKESYNPKKINYSDNIEKKIESLIPRLENILGNKIDLRWAALRILEGDTSIISSLSKYVYIEKEVD
ncbi:FeoB small GTPase domain-containing protein [Tepidibacter mesophilus]|uniref:FeoB small GTPase domain-containing protein n=1 Tax=Tepidibacter mesophilus TaxID=655607 RepID=UPI002E8E605E|nr:FeoB small GTPase domain-containing protein [Tepidibacter mesophilus]